MGRELGENEALLARSDSSRFPLTNSSSSSLSAPANAGWHSGRYKVQSKLSFYGRLYKTYTS